MRLKILNLNFFNEYYNYYFEMTSLKIIVCNGSILFNYYDYYYYYYYYCYC